MVRALSARDADERVWIADIVCTHGGVHEIRIIQEVLQREFNHQHRGSFRFTKQPCYGMYLSTSNPPLKVQWRNLDFNRAEDSQSCRSKCRLRICPLSKCRLRSRLLGWVGRTFV
jgi:hypothetical protein